MIDSDYDGLMQQSYALEDGPTKVSLLEQASRLADQMNDPSRGFESRSQLIRSSVFSGMAERALPAFSWCLAQIDKAPQEFGDDEMLWEYKWILPALLQFPSIRLQQIIDLEDDFARRLKKAGYSLRPFYEARFDRLEWSEQPDEKKKYFELWRKSKRDHLANCRACEESGVVSYYFESQQPELALTKAYEMLENRVGCHSVPHSMISKMLLPLLRLGRFAEAKELHTRGYRMIRNNRDFLGYVRAHMVYLLHVGEIASALRILTRHIPWCLETRELLDKLDFCHGAAVVLEKAGHRKRKLNVPLQHPCYNETGSYVPSELAAWFSSEAEGLAHHFDERNGDRQLKDWMEESRAEIGTIPHSGE